ncbi:hypothetical protein QCA50_006473 [Cerrena zonata]|uniref:MYND-type domain-containing protein n=1 Tax=Cerrena zonata TaxID=2478898 RepID=A0AAW0GDQ3_9APHY
MPSLRAEMSKCYNCGVKGSVKTLQKCSKCKAAKYCSRECQKADWATHKPSCNNNSELAEALKEQDNTPMGLIDRIMLPDNMSLYELDQRLAKWVKFHNAMLMWATIHALGIPVSENNARTMVLHLKIKPT